MYVEHASKKLADIWHVDTHFTLEVLISFLIDKNFIVHHFAK